MRKSATGSIRTARTLPLFPYGLTRNWLFSKTTASRAAMKPGRSCTAAERSAFAFNPIYFRSGRNTDEK